MAPLRGRANLSHFLPPLLLALSSLCVIGASEEPRSISSLVKALEDVKYKVSVEGAQAAGNEGPEEGDGHLMRFMDDEGVLKTYSCKLPGPAERMNPNARASASAVAVTDDEEAARRAREILDQGLKNQCFLKPSGWWIYEFCHNRWVRQYHQDSQNKVRTEHLLGVGKLSPVFDQDFIRTGPTSSATGEVTFGKDSTGPYYSTLLRNGSICDMTKEPRELEVRYYCSKAAEQVSNSMSISEPYTCKYRLTFFTPVACSIPSFQKQPDYTRTIGCTEISRDSEAEAPQNAVGAGQGVTGRGGGEAEALVAEGAPKAPE